MCSLDCVVCSHRRRYSKEEGALRNFDWLCVETVLQSRRRAIQEVKRKRVFCTCDKKTTNVRNRKLDKKKIMRNKTSLRFFNRVHESNKRTYAGMPETTKQIQNYLVGGIKTAARWR